MKNWWKTGEKLVWHLRFDWNKLSLDCFCSSPFPGGKLCDLFQSARGGGTCRFFFPRYSWSSSSPSFSCRCLLPFGPSSVKVSSLSTSWLSSNEILTGWPGFVEEVFSFCLLSTLILNLQLSFSELDWLPSRGSSTWPGSGFDSFFSGVLWWMLIWLKCFEEKDPDPSLY